MKFQNVVCFTVAASTIVSAAPYEEKYSKKSKVDFPFSQMVAFGDNLSDNGNGSYAHCVANPDNCKDTIYGYRTWTNGPVAVSYLSTALGVPLTLDYAFGGADGGSKIGATINNSYTASMYAPDGFQQVANYTSTAPNLQRNIGNTLHFVWIGNNDINLKHILTSSSVNQAFANQMSSQMVDLIGNLVDAGAQYIFVVGLYAKNISPSRQFLATGATQIQNLANAISGANQAIQAKLQKNFKNQVIYYDVFSFMMQLYNNADSYGITHILPEFCDGYSQKDWNLCVTQGRGDEFYWMQYTDMTTYVDYLIAQDMAQTIKQEFS